ncbi:MAG: VOC family protein [Gemmatimonadetes bacterium]|nr:VOC family protein [Gemmatimonadota bacterium]MCZ6918524.1 VOC family protein [Gemmatimonadota bacterium]
MRSNRLAGRILAGVPVWLAMNACAGPVVTVPPLTPTPSGTHRVGKFVWQDLLTDDVAAAKRFYAGLFGWEFAVADDDSTYTVILHRGRAIGGMVATADLEAHVNSSQWLGSLSVADVDRAVDVVKNSGGAVRATPRDLPERGRIAVVTDPQGALVAFVRSGGGDPDDREAMPGEWLWSELWTTDTDAAMSFYETLVGYTRQRVDGGVTVPYYLLSAGDAPRAGVLEIPFDGVRPNWLPYVRVDDPAALAARVESLGGRVLIPVREETRGGTVALIADPTGGVLAIQKWPLEADERDGGR